MCALLCAGSGCASIFRSKAATEPPPAESTSAPQKPAPGPAREATTRESNHEPTTHPAAKREPAPHEDPAPGNGGSAAPAPEMPPTAPPASVSLAPSLTPEERTRLEGEVEADVRVTSTQIAAVDRASLSASELDQLRAAEALLVAVAEAKKSDDVTAAARLAHKARLLVEELVH